MPDKDGPDALVRKHGVSPEDLCVREGGWEVAAVPNPQMRHRRWTMLHAYVMARELCSYVTRLTSVIALEQVISISRFLQETCENFMFELAAKKTNVPHACRVSFFVCTLFSSSTAPSYNVTQSLLCRIVTLKHQVMTGNLIRRVQ